MNMKIIGSIAVIAIAAVVLFLRMDTKPERPKEVQQIISGQAANNGDDQAAQDIEINEPDDAGSDSGGRLTTDSGDQQADDLAGADDNNDQQQQREKRRLRPGHRNDGNRGGDEDDGGPRGDDETPVAPSRSAS